MTPQGVPEQVRRRLTLLLVAMINGLVLYGVLAVLFGDRITAGEALVEFAPWSVVGLLALCVTGAMAGLFVGRSGGRSFAGSADQIAAAVLARRILGAAVVEGFGFISILLGVIADAFPLALMPAAVAVMALLLLRPGEDEWRRLMRRAQD